MKFTFHPAFICALVLLFSCSKRYTITGTQTGQTRIKADSLHLYDSATHYYIAPYKAKLDSQMNAVVGVTQTTLVKERPEGTLCNLMADAAVWYAANHYRKKIDLCIMNYGGVRIPSIQAGTITVGKLYELMPFDNQLEVLELSGQTVKELLDFVAANGGWPAAGITMTIENGKATNILIGGEPLQIEKTYILITTDYLANGGDNASMLKTFSKRVNLDYKLRDAIIDYVKFTGTLNLTKNGRITVKP
jgi:2',3'-cyclic-nucleotide 2'-phosphodiesterase (5'-nucleotidase family)